MNRCPSCAVELSDTLHLCPHHHGPDPAWAATNRVMCDLLHRGVVPARLRTGDRDEDLRGCLQVAA